MGDKSYQSGVTIKLGLIDFAGDLWTVKKTNAGAEEKSTTVCPTCEEPHKVNQFYKCSTDESHTGFTQKECHKAKEVDGALVKVSADAVKAAKSSNLEPNFLELNVHKAEDVACKTVENGTAYVIRVGKKKDAERLGVLRDLLARRSDLVLMGQVNLRSADKLMRLVPGLNDQLMLLEMVWPEDMDAYEEPSSDYKPEMLDVAEKFADTLITDFDADAYKKAAREKMAALTEAAKTGAPLTLVPEIDSDDDLMAALMKAVA